MAKIAIGSDHRGVEIRQNLMGELQTDHELIDFGTLNTDACDYPDIAEEVARSVASGEVDRGILICGTGIGMSIAANKIAGVRAVICRNQFDAEMSRRHNDANVLCLSTEQATNEIELVRQWLKTEFEGGRHQSRVDKIAELESKSCESPLGRDPS